MACRQEEMQLRVYWADVIQVHDYKHRFRAEMRLLREQYALCRVSERQWAELAVLYCSHRIESALRSVWGFSFFLPLRTRCFQHSRLLRHPWHQLATCDCQGWGLGALKVFSSCFYDYHRITVISFPCPFILQLFFNLFWSSLIRIFARIN
mgnify:FL=1